MNFDELHLPEPLFAAIADLGYREPTAIQVGAIPALLAGRDLTGVAQTGTGKTAAFGLPLLAGIDPERRGVQALVLTPTRELALQVCDAITGFATYLDNVRVLPVYGGAPYHPQLRALASGVAVVVGTPGRVMDLMDRGALQLDAVQFLVLDEADEMLRMGFAEDVERIFAQVPKPRQVALFSATMPSAIRLVAATHLVDPLEVSIVRETQAVDSVHQTYAIVPFRHKIGALQRVLATSDVDAAIVFCRTRVAAEEVGSALIAAGFAAATISGDVPQKERERIVERLRTGALDVLVATDVAARGLDLDRVGLVVNFDIPRDPEAYVHRIGRTGRAGRTGEAICFVTPHERSRLRHIENTIKARVTEVEVPSPREVSAHRASRVLMNVPNRRKAGRLDLYTQLVREHLLAGSDYDIVDPQRAVELAAILLALAVGDDGPRAQAEQEEYEAQQAREQALRSSREVREVRRAEGGRREESRRGEVGEARRPVRRDGVVTRYRIAVGHRDGVTPAAIVGALTGESPLRGADIGKIDIFGSFSLVDVAAPLDRSQMATLGKARVAGRALRIAEDRGPRAGARPPKRQPR